MRFQFMGALLFVAACAASPATQAPEVLSSRIASETQSNLCTAYRDPTTTPLGKLMIEAELASRGVNQCLGQNYGGSSAAALGTSLYSRQGAPSRTTSNDLRNCSDFSSGAAAQKFFLASGGPLSDPNNLDGDGDGLACEWGTQVSQIARYRAPVATPVRSSVVRPSASRCYTGPRGGRYTLTAGGRKNYGAC